MTNEAKEQLKMMVWSAEFIRSRADRRLKAYRQNREKEGLSSCLSHYEIVDINESAFSDACASVEALTRAYGIGFDREDFSIG